MSVGERIKALCESKGIPVARLEQDLGYSNAYIQGLIKTGRYPAGDRLIEIAEYLKVSIETLTGEKKKNPLVINVLGKVSAGVPINAVENIIGQEELRPDFETKGEYFGLKIQGNSMSPEIKNGDTVIVRIQPDAESGDIVVAYVNGYDGVCKKLKRYKDEIQLVSINPDYEPYSSKEFPIEIVGKVIEVRREY